MCLRYVISKSYCFWVGRATSVRRAELIRYVRGQTKADDYNDVGKVNLVNMFEARIALIHRTPLSIMANNIRSLDIVFKTTKKPCLKSKKFTGHLGAVEVTEELAKHVSYSLKDLNVENIKAESTFSISGNSI